MKTALLVCLLTLAAAVRAQEPTPSPAPTEAGAEGPELLAELEARFFQMGQEQGARTAFLHFLADDSIAFEPSPQNAKKVWEKREEGSIWLTWRPVIAAIARSHDLGYTTGPSEWRRNKTDETPFGHGQYVTIWKKQKDGEWKVALDVGGGVPGVPKNEEPLELAPTSEAPPTPVKPGAAAKKLREAENWFTKTARSDSTAALIGSSDPAIRVLREGVYPAIGRAAAGLMLSVRRGALTQHRTGGDISEAGDLAYSYGNYKLDRSGTPERGHYLQIWRTDKEGTWRITLDYQSPLPVEQKKPAA